MSEPWDSEPQSQALSYCDETPQRLAQDKPFDFGWQLKNKIKGLSQ
jgi:hypothetical protein